MNHLSEPTHRLLATHLNRPSHNSTKSATSNTLSKATNKINQTQKAIITYSCSTAQISFLDLAFYTLNETRLNVLLAILRMSHPRAHALSPPPPPPIKKSIKISNFNRYKRKKSSKKFLITEPKQFKKNQKKTKNRDTHNFRRGRFALIITVLELGFAWTGNRVVVFHHFSTSESILFVCPKIEIAVQWKIRVRNA